MSEMFERAAKAAKEAALNMHTHFDDYVAAEVARAVMEAMREPTEEMRDAIRQVWRDHERKRVSITGGGGSLAHPDWEVHYWQAGVDAALATEPVS